MNSRERVKAIIAREPVDHTALWIGNPDPKTWPILHNYFGTTSEEELRLKLGDDFRWCAPEVHIRTYYHPKGREMFDLQMEKTHHGQAGPFANCEDVRQVEEYEWPKVEYLDFTDVKRKLQTFKDTYRASGFWTPFYHHVMDLFGMEDYLVKMFTHPEVVQSVTDHVCQFYYDANELFFKECGEYVDGFFFGNDFGTQRDTIMSPRLFDKFVMPWFKTFTKQGHDHGKQVILHSCGSIYRVIPRLIEAGVDCLHPLQAKAANMNAEKLSDEFGGKISFLGGIDAQNVLPHGTIEEVKQDVRRVKKLFGPNVIISPSHEAILPDVPPANVQAMVEAAHEN